MYDIFKDMSPMVFEKSESIFEDNNKNYNNNEKNSGGHHNIFHGLGDEDEGFLGNLNQFFSNGAFLGEEEEDLATSNRVIVAKTKKEYPKIEKNKDFKLSETDPARKWDLVEYSQDFADSGYRVTLKNRIEKPVECVPVVLYSSIQYQVAVSLEGQAFDQLPIIVSKIWVVDENGKKVTVDFKGKKPVSGVIEAAMSKKNGDDRMSLSGDLKFKLGDLTYHRNMAHYMLRIGFFLPEDLHDAILILQTPLFRNYARKPNKPKSKQKKKKKKKVFDVNEKKRKRVIENDPRKRRKISEMEEFEEKLDELMGIHESLDEEKRTDAMKILLDKLCTEFHIDLK